MIVYNVGRRFFALKVDAEKYRRAERLKPGATVELRIDDRYQLAGFLDGLCAISTGSALHRRASRR